MTAMPRLDELVDPAALAELRQAAGLDLSDEQFDAWEAKHSELDLETKVRKVRTREGAEFYGEPIGSPITLDMVQRARRGGGKKPGAGVARAARAIEKRASGKPPSDSAMREVERRTAKAKDHAELVGRVNEASRTAERMQEQVTGVAKTPNIKPLKVPKEGAAAIKDIAVEGKPNGKGTPDDPIDVGDDLDKAVQLLGEGKHIRLRNTVEVGTVLEKLTAVVEHAKAAGEQAPNYNLCAISVPDTNLFCKESKGVPRVKMPQLSGTPLPGSVAHKLMGPDDREANITSYFRKALEDRGVTVTTKTVKASSLRASQDELDGPKVAGMAKAMEEGKIPDVPVFVTRDGYVIDGHHRWAAKVSIDAKDGQLGDIEMPVDEVDLDIGAALDFANAFAEAMGIKPKGLGAAAEGADVAASTTGPKPLPDLPPKPQRKVLSFASIAEIVDHVLEHKSEEIVMEVKGRESVNGLEHKNDGATAVIDADDETGLVTAIVSVTGVEDRVQDIIEPGAYNETLAARDPIGVWSHDDKTWVARAEEVKELPPGDPFFRSPEFLEVMQGAKKEWPKDAGALLVKSRFNLETPHGAAAYSDVKFFRGRAGWSIGYRVKSAKRDPRTGVRRIKSLDLFEFSPVMVGAAHEAMTLSVKSWDGRTTVDPDVELGLIEYADADEVKDLLAARADLYAAIEGKVFTAADDDETKRAFSSEKRRVLADKGAAMDDGSFPIENEEDLDNAIKAVGRAKDPAKAKAHIRKRARALGLHHKLTDGVKADDPTEDAEDLLLEHKALLDAIDSTDAEVDETKGVRRVRTPEGARAFHLPIGAAIVPGMHVRTPNGSGIVEKVDNDSEFGLVRVKLDPADALVPNERVAFGKHHVTPTADLGSGRISDAATGHKDPEAREVMRAGFTEIDDLPDELEDWKRVKENGHWTPPYDKLMGAMAGDIHTSKALQHYVGSMGINVDLRRGDEPNDDVREMDALFDASPGLSEDEILYRGLSLPSAADIARFKPGTSFTDLGFVSTTDDDVAASAFASARSGGAGGEGFERTGNAPLRIAILARRGTPVVPGLMPGEREMILPRGGTFTVRAIGSKGTVFVEYAAPTERKSWDGMEYKADDDADRYVWNLDDLRFDDDEDTETKDIHTGSLPAATSRGFGKTAFGGGVSRPVVSGSTLAKVCKACGSKSVRSVKGTTTCAMCGLAHKADNPLLDEIAALRTQLEALEAKAAIDVLDGDLDEDAPGTGAPEDDDDDDGFDLSDEPDLETEAEAIEAELDEMFDDDEDLDEDDELDEWMAGVGTKAASMVHEPLDRSPKKNWVEKSGQLPAYIQHIAKDIHEKGGKSLSHAIAIAIAAVKRWATGQGNVNADTRAKAAAAVAEWEALKVKNKARKAGKAVARAVSDATKSGAEFTWWDGIGDEVKTYAVGELLTDEDDVWEIDEEKGLLKRVRSAEGEREYHLPIGALIHPNRPHALQGGAAGREVEHAVNPKRPHEHTPEAELHRITEAGTNSPAEHAKRQEALAELARRGHFGAEAVEHQKRRDAGEPWNALPRHGKDKPDTLKAIKRDLHAHKITIAEVEKRAAAIHERDGGGKATDRYNALGEHERHDPDHIAKRIQAHVGSGGVVSEHELRSLVKQIHGDDDEDTVRKVAAKLRKRNVALDGKSLLWPEEDPDGMVRITEAELLNHQALALLLD